MGQSNVMYPGDDAFPPRLYAKNTYEKHILCIIYVYMIIRISIQEVNNSKLYKLLFSFKTIVMVCSMLCLFCQIISTTMASSNGLLLVFVLLLAERIHCFTPTSSKHAADNFNVPCKYLDSISMAELDEYAQLVDNHNHTTTDIDSGIGFFDYEILNNTFRQPVARHQRVCVCKERPCIRLRCPRGEMFNQTDAQCYPSEHVRDLSMRVVSANGVDRRTVNVFEHFGYTVGRVCELMSPLEPEMYPTDVWEMNEVG